MLLILLFPIIPCILSSSPIVGEHINEFMSSCSSPSVMFNASCSSPSDMFSIGTNSVIFSIDIICCVELPLGSVIPPSSSNIPVNEVAKSLTSTSEDLFGPTVNLCSKINSKASPNQMVIGNNLYQITKSTFGSSEYHFNKADEYPIDSNSKNQYPVFSIVSKNQKNNDDRVKMYKNIV